MSVELKTGKPGAGKGLVIMAAIRDELVNGQRNIVTNLPIRTMPWVTPDGRPQMGLAAYLKHTHQADFDYENRLKIIEEEEEGKHLFLWRRHPERGWFKLEPIRKDGKEVAFETASCTGCGSNFVITDEAWKFYPSRRWTETGQIVEFYARQHRKFGDHWWIVTQSYKDVDVNLARVTQLFSVVRNHSKERIGYFKQPNWFTVKHYVEPPAPNAVMTHSEKFRLDVKGLAQCYDTAAGVGIGGAGAADTSEKTKGLPFWLIPTLVGVGCIILMILPRYIGPLISKTLIPQPGKTTNAPAVKVILPRTNVPSNSPSSVRMNNATNIVQRRSPVPGPGRDEKETQVSGWGILRGKMFVYFTDGRSVTSDNPALSFVGSDFVIYEGRKIEMAPSVVSKPLPKLSSIRQ